MAAPRLLEGYLFSSTVLWFWLCFASHCWQIASELLHHGCDLNNVRIWTKHCVFSVGRRFRCRESWLACATVAGVAALAWNHSRCARNATVRVPGDFFSSLLMLCYCVLHVLRHFFALELMHQSDMFSGLWRPFFFHFGADDFPFKVPFKNASKSSFFRLGAVRFWSCNLCICSDWFYWVWHPRVCRSQWNGCVKVPHCCSCACLLQLRFANRIVVAALRLPMALWQWQQNFSSLALMIFLLYPFIKFLFKSASKSSFFCLGVVPFLELQFV